MRINEAYEHEALLPSSAEEACCTINSCNKTSTQLVDVTALADLSPTAVLGTPTVTCQGSPVVTCTTNSDGSMCTVTMTQQVRISIPVRYGVSIEPGEPTIACSDCCGH